ncbi:MAG: molybdopterin biosynthesis protein [Firmicutes bacterium]|nr:molybdopterin biosynthesis protein [Bacillota bacterium]
MAGKGITIEANALDETLERWLLELDFRDILKRNPTEIIPVAESLWRISAGPVAAERSSPHYYAALIDGVALMSSKTYGATRDNPLRLKIGKDAFFVDTGMPMPQGCDCVAPLDGSQLCTLEEVEITETIAPWQDVRPLGEDMAAREVILQKNQRINPFDVAALYTGGILEIEVVKKLKVGILPIGSGLIPAGQVPTVGQNVEITSQILKNLAKTWGAQTVVYDIVAENQEAISAKIDEILCETELLCVIAGPSRGTELIADYLQEKGELFSWGLKVKPGMSACTGAVKCCPVIGLPGYFSSSFIVFDLFAKPVIQRKMGAKIPERKTVRAYLSQNLKSTDGAVEFIRTNLGNVDNIPVAVPISRGADALMSLVRADGIIKIEADRSEIKAGEIVNIDLLRPDGDIRTKIMLAGTYDICFDLLRDKLLEQFDDLSLVMSNMGSMKGLAALGAGYCHIASVHLFDDESGEYNTPIIRRLFRDMPLIAINCFHRHLGFMVPKGNPKKIKNLFDLTRPDIKIINRFRGAGTRLVFDYHLRENQIDINQINGYSNEVHTHMTVAHAVSSGSADVGMGIAPAAKASGLDFIPLIKERLDLVIPKKFLNSYPVKSFMKILNSKEFKEEAGNLDGYDFGSTGTIIYEK